MQDSLRNDLKDNKVELPEELKSYSNQITGTLKKVAGNLNVKNADDKKIVNLIKNNNLKAEKETQFKKLLLIRL